MKLLSISTVERYTETVGQRNEIDDIMTLVLIIQRIFGQQILDPNWTWKRFILHHVLIASLMIYVSFGTYEVVKNTNDVKLIAEAGYTCLILAMTPLKYLIFVANRIRFSKLYLQLKTIILEAIKHDSAETVKEVLRKGIKVVYLLLTLTLLPILTYMFTALWFYIQGNKVTLSRTTSILMPMTSPYYEIGTVLHAIFLSNVGFTLIMIDMWFVLLVYFYIIANDCVVKNLNVDDKRFNENDEDYSERLNGSLRKFYTAHVKQLNYLNDLNKMFKWLSLVPLLHVSLGACILLLAISKGINGSLAALVLPTFAEIVVYSWFGEQIKTKVEKLNIALLNFDWINLTRENKKCYYIIVCYMNKNFGIQTAVGDELSLITMSSVLQASYQAFTVLQSLDN